MEHLQQAQQVARNVDGNAEADDKSGSYGGGRGRSMHSQAPSPPVEPNAASVAFQRSVNAQPDPTMNGSVERIANQLRGNGNRIRIEGFARSGDNDPRTASLDRANAVRDQFIASGLPPEQVEAVGTGRVSDRDGVRVLVADNEPPRPSQAAPHAAQGPASDEPIGTALFVAD